MLRVYLKLIAINDMESGWKRDEILEMEVNIFDKQNGLAYWELDKNWDILEMELIDYKKIK